MNFISTKFEQVNYKWVLKSEDHRVLFVWDQVPNMIQVIGMATHYAVGIGYIQCVDTGEQIQINLEVLA